MTCYQELIDKLNTPRTTIVENCHKLEKKGVIIKIKKKKNFNRGRPTTYWKLK